LTDLSVVFPPIKWETRNGVKTLIAGELLAADIVSIASNVNAQVLSVRSAPHPATARARDLAFETERDLVRLEVAQAKALLARLDPRPSRTRTNAFLKGLMK
jgi:hypothetical protein